MVSSPGEAKLLLDKWQAEGTLIYAVFVGPDKAVKFSFAGLVEKVEFPSVQLRSFVSEVSVNVAGAQFRYSDPREAPPGIEKTLGKYSGALDAIFPDGGVCTFCEISVGI
jgi:hypothetical protein